MSVDNRDQIRRRLKYRPTIHPVRVETPRLVLSGQQTTIRLLARGMRPPVEPGRVYPLEDARVVRRNDQAIADGRRRDSDDPVIGAIHITDVDRENLWDLTFDQARAAGHTNRLRRPIRDFYDAWFAEHPTPPSLERRHGEWRLRPRDVWVIRFELAELPRFLHRDAAQAYTHDPREAIDLVEAVDAGTLTRFAVEAEERARTGESAYEYRKREAKAIAARIREQTARAQKHGANIDPNLAVIRAELDAIDRQIDEAA